MSSSQGMGEGRSGSSSSSRRGKKSGSDKPKQLQRGLGVAQLEKIRLHSQMTAGYVPSLHHHPPFNNKEDDVLELGFASSPSSSAYTADKNIKNSAQKIPVFHVRSGLKVVIEEKIEGRSVQETAVTIQFGYIVLTTSAGIMDHEEECWWKSACPLLLAKVFERRRCYLDEIRMV